MNGKKSLDVHSMNSITLISFKFNLTEIQRVNCTVQVVVESADKNGNAYQVFADFRCEKSTQVNEHHRLSHKEEAKIELDGVDIEWIKHGSTPSTGISSNRWINYNIKQAIRGTFSLQYVEQFRQDIQTGYNWPRNADNCHSCMLSGSPTHQLEEQLIK